MSAGREPMNPRIQGLLAELKAGLMEIYGERLKGAYVFGSYARGEEDGESDVDILIVLDQCDDYGAEIDRTGALVASTALRHGTSISRVFVPESDWLSGDTSFLATVREEAVPT
jgi:predicted nucleotidyltransferase